MLNISEGYYEGWPGAQKIRCEIDVGPWFENVVLRWMGSFPSHNLSFLSQ
jgi:hypothetical protein